MEQSIQDTLFAGPANRKERSGRLLRYPIEVKVKMICADCQTQLLDYEHGELKAAEDAAVFGHLQSCGACRAILHDDRQLVDSLRASFGAEREIPTAVIATVRQAMRATAPPAFGQRLRALLRPVIVGPAAAAVIIAAVSLAKFGVSHNETGPALPANYFVRQHVAQTLGLPSTDRAWATYLLTSVNAQSAPDTSAP